MPNLTPFQPLSSRQRAVLLLAAKIRLASKRDETPVHKVADAHLNAMTVAVMFGFLRGRKAYKSGGAKAAISAIRAALLVSLPPVLLKCVAAGGEVAFRSMPQRRAAQLRTLAPIDIRFDVSDPEAVQWAEDHAAELAKDLSDTSEQAIKDAIAAALAGDGLDAAYDDILDAVGDEERASMIARTETMNAANEGLARGWSKAQDAGLLPANATKQWIATSDACDECDSLDGEEVALDDDFSAGDDPPLHPNCRCTMGIGTGEA